MLTAISLFASGGIGDLALRENGVEVLVANELLTDRASIFQHNFPDTEMIVGSILAQKESIINCTKEKLQGRALDILYATPPCQGMSKNGRGTILNNIRKGIRPELDVRNQLIIPAIEIAKIMNPRMIILENVPEMQDTIIETEPNRFELILDYVQRVLGESYVGKGEIVEFADYGVPQKRQRLITVFTRDANCKSFYQFTKSFLPERTHSQKGASNTKKWNTLRNTIAHFPALDAQNKTTANSSIPFHNVPLLDTIKYFWVSNTPSERGAFDNQCVVCGCRTNPTHGASVTTDGINRSRTDTPIYCVSCSALLPRPSVKDGERYRLMKGFTSAYKRMSWDAPANALTTNLSYACSDSKLHPAQHRVLSLYEAFHIHTINYFHYEWKRADQKPVSNKTIREIIGESIPPQGLSVIMQQLSQILLTKDIDSLISTVFKGQVVLL